MSEILDGRYRIGPPLGEGGMGRVYAAEDVQTGIVVAIKMLFGSPDSERLHSEIDALHEMGHPNIVRVFAHGATPEGVPYLVMERLRGTPLGVAIRRDGALAYPRIARIGAQILAGLGALHERGYIHADIKSDNVLVEAQADDRTKLIDVGLSPISPANRQWFTGTPEYVAPEVILGEAPGVASDLYGVGIVLFEMVTGTTPFAGGTPDQIFDRHIDEIPVTASVRCPDRVVPAALDALIARALEKQPASRPPSAAVFAHELALALAPQHEHEEQAAPVAFSTRANTRDWIPQIYMETAPWRRRV